MSPLRTLLGAATLGVAAFFLSPVAMAQGLQGGSAILVLNQDRLLNITLYGQRLQEELEAASAALAAENRQIEAQLTEEELELTERRPTMEPDDFRALADEFDTRVTAIRAAQDAKTRDLQAQAEAAQQRFVEETIPILLQIIEDRDGAILLDSRTVLLSAGSVDITDAAAAAIDAAIGDGGPEPIIDLPGLEIAPEDDPDAP